MPYIENPKTAGSGIICCIPQSGRCPVNCDDCFFQSGRSYLEPLDENLPNMPTEDMAKDRVVRVNDGNDSSHDRDIVIADTEKYSMRFFNTSFVKEIETFPDPVVLTLNPAQMTDKDIHKLNPVPGNIMFLRFRANMWNMHLFEDAVSYYHKYKIPIVVTFMRYYEKDSIPSEWQNKYEYKKKIINSYWVLNDSGKFWWSTLIEASQNQYGKDSILVCGDYCKDCGICLRTYFKTKENMRD